MIPIDLHYTNPSIVYFILIAILLFSLFIRLALYRKSKISGYMIPDVTTPRSRWKFWVQVIAICAAWILGIIALMQPRGNGHYPEAAFHREPHKTEQLKVKRKMHDVVILVDVSASMETDDTRSNQSRLEYAKEIADVFLENLKGESVSLYAFTSQPTQMSPPTMDYLFTRMMLRELKINEGEIAGTDIAETLGQIREKFYSSSSNKLTSVILLTDGGDTRLENLRGEAHTLEENAIVNLAGGAERLNLRLFTIGMGSKEGKQIPGFTVYSSLNDSLLKKLGQRARGRYYFANDWSPLGIAEDMTNHMAKDDPYVGDEMIVQTSLTDDEILYDHYFQVPLGGAILLLAFFIFLPEARRMK